MRRYLFRSGNHEHPSDKFYNTTVEVLPDVLSEESIVWQQFNTTTDGYLIVGSFNGFGIAEGSIDNRLGKLRELRLHVHSESENWVILSEVSYKKWDQIERELIPVTPTDFPPGRQELKLTELDWIPELINPPKVATENKKRNCYPMSISQNVTLAVEKKGQSDDVRSWGVEKQTKKDMLNSIPREVNSKWVWKVI